MQPGLEGRPGEQAADAVQQAGYTLDDDEFECIETSSGMWYEFEARKDRREYDLRVDTNGNIEAYED